VISGPGRAGWRAFAQSGIKHIHEKLTTVSAFLLYNVGVMGIAKVKASFNESFPNYRTRIAEN
jgi:hypothetical protein